MPTRLQAATCEWPCLGAPLFDRTGTPIALTEQGAALQGAAQRILDAVQAARDEVAAAVGQVRGTVTLGSTLHTGRLDLAAVLSEVRERHPAVVVHLRQFQTGSRGLVQAVRDGALDIALTAATGDVPRGIAMHPLFSEPMVFICQPSHPLAERDCVTVADLKQEMILRPPPGWGTRTLIDEALGANSSAFEIGNYTLLAQLVRAGFAATLTPESAISGHLLAGLRAIPVDDCRLRWSLSAAVCTDRRQTAATTVVLEALTKGAKDCADELTPDELSSHLPAARPPSP